VISRSSRRDHRRARRPPLRPRGNPYLPPRAGEVGHGSTAATTALIQYEIDTHLVDLIDRVGADHAIRSYRLCLQAVWGIEELAGAAGGGCAWRCTKSLYLASHRSDRRVLEREHLARRTAGIEVALLDERDIRQRFSFARPAH